MVEQSIKDIALAHGFTEAARNVYEQPASYPVDPILGLVKTSDVPNSILRFAVDVQSAGHGTLVRTAPCTVNVSGKGRPFYWKPGTSAHALVVEIIESGIADAMAQVPPSVAVTN